MIRQLKDYYEVMGIPRNATPDDIKTVYRALVKRYHPDVNKTPEAESVMKEINEAYDILSDSDKRARYDMLTQPQPTIWYSSMPTYSTWTITITQW